MDDFLASKLHKEKLSKTSKASEEEVIEEGKEKFNFMELLNNPALSKLLSSGKDLFKKEKADPNICEITIKAPSEVVLKLFHIAG